MMMLMRIRMRPDQAAATVAATTTTALAMAMAMSMPQQSEQCNALKFTFHGGSSELQLQSLTWVIARQKDKTVACTDRQRDRQADGRGNEEGRQKDRQVGRQAGRQAPVRALAGLICMRSNFQGFCCCRRDSAIILRVAFDISDTI